jgi:type IV secretion system protein VirB11
MQRNREAGEGAAFVVLSESGSGALLREKLQMLGTLVADPAVRAVCINRPGEVFTQVAWGWRRHEIASLSLRWCEELLQAAHLCNAEQKTESNVLSAVFPEREGIQVIAPPAVEDGTVAIAISRPPPAAGQHEMPSRSEPPLSGEEALMERRLSTLRSEREYWAFYAAAIAARKNIVISEPTGSGGGALEQTFTKFFVSGNERVLVLGPKRELVLPGHRNRVHIIYPAGDAPAASVLVNASCRMAPDRVLLAQMHPDIAHAYVTKVACKYRGCITSVRANTCEEAIERLADAVRGSNATAKLTRTEAVQLLAQAFDVIVQFQAGEGTDESGRHRKLRHIDAVRDVRDWLSCNHPCFRRAGRRRFAAGGRPTRENMPALQIHCPHCDHASEDLFGVLDPDAIDTMRCEQCANPFCLAIMECQRCAHEQVFTWGPQPPDVSLSMLTCETCGNTSRRNNGAVQEKEQLE